MITVIEKNLERGVKLLQSITNDQYSKSSTPPYFSSIGSHTRHILDVFQCIFDGLPHGFIDFTNRKRNFIQEQSTEAGLEYFKLIINELQTISENDLEKKILVADDLGGGIITTTYTLGAVLAQAQTHTIHHYAIIGFLVYDLGIELPDTDFGYNPTTPKKELLN